MDAFFASVEVRRRPELAGRPVIVGGTGPRGVVCSASYEARRFGVRSAMPGGMARGLCPSAVFIAPDFAAYQAASRTVMGIFRDVTPLVEPLSLDEAFLDVAGAVRLLGSPATIGVALRRRVFETLGLRCSVGVASTMHVAKLGSTRAKPDGLVVVPADRVLAYLHPLPVSALWGVGERSEQALRRVGIVTVGDIARASPRLLRSALGVAAASHLRELAQGRDSRRVTPDHQEKSLGAETTFDVDVEDPAMIRRALLALSGRTAVRLRRTGHTGRTVSIKVRYASFQTLSRSQTLTCPTDVAREIFATAWALFVALPATGRIRLVGVRVEGLVDVERTPRQLALDAPEHGWRELERATDAVTARFGEGLVRPASLLRGEDPPADGNGGIPPSYGER
jgi:DNA polymerase-4